MDIHIYYTPFWLGCPVFWIRGAYEPLYGSPVNGSGADTSMAQPQYLPIAPELFAHACDTVTKRVSQLPFLRGGVHVTGELVGVVMECLNAEPTRALALTTPKGVDAMVARGLDLILEERLDISGKTVVPVITEVLCSAGITEMTDIADRQIRKTRRAVHLLPPWTWHIASTMAPSVRLGGVGADAGASLSWLDTCPICRTGILERVTGKQLFGIPHTDFIIECSHCGAKFIPVGPAFRLVSIAKISDPLWKRYLDKTNTPEIWATIARGPGSGTIRSSSRSSTSKQGVALGKPAGHEPTPHVLPPASVTVTALKDGSLAIPLPGKNLYFRPIPLKFTGGAKEDTFTRIQKSLEEVLQEPAFEHLRDPVNAKYSRYLPMKIGLFLGHLKERFDPFYREFLNPFGDEKFGSFRTGDSGEAEKRGVLIVAVNRGLYHVADSSEPLYHTINNHFGRVGPDDCLLTGDPARCRVNALLSNNQKEAGLFFYSAEREADRLTLVQSVETFIRPNA